VKHKKKRTDSSSFF